MTQFFDQKQEVLDVQLTQYGKYLLSRGKLRPEYYAFFDQDIIYDGEYAGITEPQNDAQDRIRNLTPRTKSQYLYTGIETQMKQIIQESKGEDGSKKEIKPFPEKPLAYATPLGNMSTNAVSSPGYGIKFLKAPLSSSVNYYQTNSALVQIPQLETAYTVTYTVEEGAGIEAENDGEGFDQEGSPNNQDLSSANSSEAFLDGSFYLSSHKYLFLEASQKNVFFDKENFDIEVFEIINDTDNATGASIEYLRKLKFAREEMNAAGTFVPEEERLRNSPELNPDFVEYWFKIETDADIPDWAFCDVDADFKNENIFIDSDIEYECDDRKPVPSELYTDTAEEQEEECD